MTLVSRLRRPLAALLLLLAPGACKDSVPTAGGGGHPPPDRPTLPQTYRPSGRSAAGDVMVHLFEWPWNDIAAECVNVLGPAGVAMVQVSPPQEHSITPNHDWSERYQPVSYSVARSRSGTGAEFQAMVNACNGAGVGIVVDAVINHMTNFPSPGTGSNGTAYTKYSYPGLYDASDFHAPCALVNYQSAANVQDCELFSLPDLATETPKVRAAITGYLVALSRMGVLGYRIDAAKHIQQGDLDAIMDAVDSTLAAEARPLPYWYLEVVGNGQGEALGPRDYFGAAYSSGGAADITEFTFVGVGDKFMNVGGQKIWQLNPNGTPGNQFSEIAWGLMPTDKALVFLQNHDTQHQNNTISYRDGQVFRLANVWMLAQPYGYPSILSSYAFGRPGQNDMGPPSDASGWTLPVTCATSFETATVGQYNCEHRDPYIRPMIAFRRIVAGTNVNHWWDNGSNAIAFTRGDKGFVAINRESTVLSQQVGTGMPAGTYCDILTGGRNGAACVGTSVIVDNLGNVQLTMAANTAIAIHANSKI